MEFFVPVAAGSGVALVACCAPLRIAR